MYDYFIHMAKYSFIIITIILIVCGLTKFFIPSLLFKEIFIGVTALIGVTAFVQNTFKKWFDSLAFRHDLLEKNINDLVQSLDKNDFLSYGVYSLDNVIVEWKTIEYILFTSIRAPIKI